jgi:hypothetical protein
VLIEFVLLAGSSGVLFFEDPQGLGFKVVEAMNIRVRTLFSLLHRTRLHLPAAFAAMGKTAKESRQKSAEEWQY